ncbi:MAG: potassium channel family protein [Phototrophicaceae bacterium]
MESLDDLIRQTRIALLIMLFLITVGVVGFMLIERLSFMDALWLTTITLTTVGYGDLHADTTAGRVFTIALIFFGFGVVAFGLQATVTFLVSPEIRNIRQRRLTRRIISKLEKHYIVCGHMGLVDATVQHLISSVKQRLTYYDQIFYNPIDKFLDGIFGDDALGYYPKTRAIVKNIILYVTRPFINIEGTLLDVVVVITEDAGYAKELRAKNIFVIEGNPTLDNTLIEAGIHRATAMLVMLDNDTQALLTVLSARNLNPDLYITAATVANNLVDKTLRIGANAVIQPYSMAGQFMNSITLRPVVYDFFTTVFFDFTFDTQASQITLFEGSPWIGKTVGELKLNEKFQGSAILGIHTHEGKYVIVPREDYTLSMGEDLIIVSPFSQIKPLHRAGQSPTHFRRIPKWQRINRIESPKRQTQTYTLDEAEHFIREMSNHYVICGTEEVLQSAIDQLNPDRPFVIVSPDEHMIQSVRSRGFRIILGDPTQEETLLRAGVDRALALMVSADNHADTVLTVMTARNLSSKLLITATALSDEYIQKITIAGADRIFNPLKISAEYVLLATTRPMVVEFFRHVLFNYQDGIETTELYMQNNSPWIGKRIGELLLKRIFGAVAIGIRQRNGEFIYAPSDEHVLNPHEILLVITPMQHADDLREAAYGSSSKRPDTLRNQRFVSTMIHDPSKGLS